MRRNEVFQDGESFHQVRFDRKFDGLTGRVGHETFHSAELSDLSPVTTSTGIHLVENVIFRFESFYHHFGDVVFRFGPNLDCLIVTLVFRDESFFVELLNLLHEIFGRFHDFAFFLRDVKVGTGNGNP